MDAFGLPFEIAPTKGEHDQPNISAYEIAKRLCKDEGKFNSFKVKVSRIVKRIGNS
jgi:hypothetical protein